MKLLEFLADCIAFVATGSTCSARQSEGSAEQQPLTQVKTPASPSPDGEICFDCQGGNKIFLKGGYYMPAELLPYPFCRCEKLIICKGRSLFEGSCPNRKIVEDAPEEDK